MTWRSSIHPKAMNCGGGALSVTNGSIIGGETAINTRTSDMIMVGVRSREETRPDTIPVVVVAMLSARI